MTETFRQLIGIADEKPFECVGSRDEVNFAITQAIKNRENEGLPLPYMFGYYKTTELWQEYKNKENPLHTYYNETNNLPEEFARIVKENCFD